MFFAIIGFGVLFRIVDCVELGEIHTSAAHLDHLVKLENAIVNRLEYYVWQEQERTHDIQSYINDWEEFSSNWIASNPINSYHFLKRLVNDFEKVKISLQEKKSDSVIEELEELRDGFGLPTEKDINGAAWAIVQLQDMYNLTLDDVIQGRIFGYQAFKGLSAKDVFRFSQQSFQNLEFDLSQLWASKGLEILQKEQPFSEGDLNMFKTMKEILHKRRLMGSLVTQLARDANLQSLGKLSGLGVPANFQRKLYHQDQDIMSDITKVQELYKGLCQGKQPAIESQDPDLSRQNFGCSFLRGRDPYRRLMPFKTELLETDPLMVLFHDVMSDQEADHFQQLAYPRLEVTKVHSFTSHKPMKSLARIGKTAWIKRNDSDIVRRVLQRVEQMTGLTTETMEDFHVLNYGVGGHYDLHVDFFDLANKGVRHSTAESAGDRIATILFYVNDVGEGGATVFPLLGRRVEPRKGSALVWLNLLRNGKGDYRTLHASCPVIMGQKWIANLWLREAGQEFRWPCSMDSEE